MSKLEAMLEAERRGILPADQKAMLDEARRRGLVQAQSAPQPEAPGVPLYQRAWNAIKGNASEDLPDLFGSQFAEQAKSIRESQGRGDLVGAAKLSAAAVFGGDEDLLNAVRREFPDAHVEQDDNGNPIVRMPDGQRYYVNQPGLDVNDIGRFAGKVLQFVPAAKLAGAASGTLARAGIGGAAAGVTDVGGQLIAQRDKIDPTQAATSAAFGAGAELLAPIAQRIGGSIREAFRSDPAKAEIGKQIAKNAGLGPVDDATAMMLYAGRNEIKAGANPAAVLAEKKFGFKLTRGQKTQDPALMDYEDYLRQIDTSSSNPLRLIKDYNEAQFGRVNEALRTQLGRGARSATDAESGTAIQSALRGAEASGRARVAQAYREADKAAGGIYAAADDFSAIPAQIDKAFKGKVALSPELTPATLGARGLLRDFAEEAGDAAVSLKRIEELRKRMNTLREAATKPTDARAMGELYKAFDEQVHGAIVRNMMDGGPEAMEALKAARGEASRMFRLFSSESESGRRILKSMAEDATPEQVANFFVGAQGVSAPQAAAVAKRYLNIVGKDSAEANALRDLVARRIFDRSLRGPQTADVTAAALEDALMGRGNSLMTSLFNTTELKVLRDYRDVIRQALLPPGEVIRGSVGRSSGTGERLFRWIQNTRLRTLPFFQTVQQSVARGASSGALSPLVMPRGSALPATAAATGSVTADERENIY